MVRNISRKCAYTLYAPQYYFIKNMFLSHLPNHFNVIISKYLLEQQPHSNDDDDDNDDDEDVNDDGTERAKRINKTQ